MCCSKCKQMFVKIFKRDILLVIVAGCITAIFYGKVYPCPKVCGFTEKNSVLSYVFILLSRESHESAVTSSLRKATWPSGSARR